MQRAMSQLEQLGSERKAKHCPLRKPFPKIHLCMALAFLDSPKNYILSKNVSVDFIRKVIWRW